MENRVELEMRGKQPSEVMELVLDNCKATQIAGLSDEFVNLTTLSMINVGLTSLEGLPKLPALRTIDLSDNKLTGDLDKLVENCSRLYHINLCANKISDVEALTPLKKLEELAALDLFDCAVTEVADYRQKVFELLPQLKYLDGFDVNDVEAEVSDEEDDQEFGAEAGDMSDEEDVGDETGDDENGLGLSYLDSSKALNDEDDSEDFLANPTATKNGDNLVDSSNDARGKKRKHEGADEDEPDSKA
jgi:hypothetical protein